MTGVTKICTSPFVDETLLQLDWVLDLDGLILLTPIIDPEGEFGTPKTDPEGEWDEISRLIIILEYKFEESVG